MRSRSTTRASTTVAAGYIARVRGPESVTDEVRASLAARVARGGKTSAIEVAAELAMSARTLQRRLQAEGTSFRALAEEVRMAEASDMLASGAATALVASTLGFSDPTAFRRAFKRSTGETPRAFVERCGNPTPSAL